LTADGNTICAGIDNPAGCTGASPGLGPSPTVPGADFYVNGIGVCGFNGIPSGCVNGAWLNFQPRLGFAYDVTGQGKTIIRGGYGIMNERVQGNDVYNNAGTVPLAASVNFTGVLLSDPTVPLSGTPPAVGIPVNNVTGLDKPNYSSPRSTQFSLGVQQSIGKSVLSVAYVGAQNRHQNYYTEINLPDESLLPGYVNGGALLPYNSVVPYVGYHGIRLSRNEANSDYNSVQASIRGNVFSNDLTYQAGYTYSHTNDSFNSGGSGGDLYNVSDPYQGWKYDFGPSMYDHRNVFFANFVYDIPFMKHSDNKLAKTLIGGWEISGIITAMSGAPLNIGVNNTVGTVNSVASIVPNSANRPNRTGSGSDPHTVAEWFDTSLYTPAVCATGPDCFGNTPRNSVWGPGRQNWNLSFFKNFVFNEARGSNLQFRAEFFNIWNHTQFQGDTQNGGVSTNLGASNFGAVTQAYDPRIIQLALKLYF